jgi:hypothetical protein
MECKGSMGLGQESGQVHVTAVHGNSAAGECCARAHRCIPNLPPGATGPTGPAGTGTVGPTGAATNGQNGPTGPQGVAGAAGGVGARLPSLSRPRAPAALCLTACSPSNSVLRLLFHCWGLTAGQVVSWGSDPWL